MSWSDKITGIKVPLDQYLLDSSTLYDRLNVQNYINDKAHLLNYLPTLPALFINQGVLAGIIFLFMIKKMIKECENNFSTSMAYLIIVSSMFTTMWFNSWFLFTYTIFYLSIKLSKGSFVKVHL
jgi:hypothetical protein